MDYINYAGVVTHVAHESSVSTSHKTMFRVAGRPVKWGKALNMGNGDHVSVVGIDKGGTLHAIAMKNDSTGERNVKRVPAWMQVVSILLRVIGVACIGAAIIGEMPDALGYGIVCGLAGIFLRFLHREKRDEVTAAEQMLNRMAAAAPAP